MSVFNLARTILRKKSFLALSVTLCLGLVLISFLSSLVTISRDKSQQLAHREITRNRARSEPATIPGLSDTLKNSALPSKQAPVLQRSHPPTSAKDHLKLVKDFELLSQQYANLKQEIAALDKRVSSIVVGNTNEGREDNSLANLTAEELDQMERDSIDVEYAQLEQDLFSRPVDSAHADDIRSRIEAILKTSGLTKSRIEKVECNESACRLFAVHKSDNARALFETALPLKLEWFGTMHSRIIDKQENVVTTESFLTLDDGQVSN